MSRDRRRYRWVAVLGALIFSCLMVTSAWAIPALQLYIEGSTYDPLTESWVIGTTDDFKLWVIGDVGHYGTIDDVKLSAAVSSSETGSITLTPTTTSLLTDPSTPAGPIPTANFPSADGAIPIRGDGSLLPTHGIYGPGTLFFEWKLGDFTLTDSPIGDFIVSFPTSFPDSGQVNVYTVTSSGFTEIHFDAYDHIYDGSRHGHYRFAPFSHDVTATPEPATALLVGSGLAGLGLWGRKRMRR